MPIHDWSRVEAGIFHDFHLAWIMEIKRALNERLLPSDYYALAEQRAAGLEPDVLTLRARQDNGHAIDRPPLPPTNGGGVCLAPPPVALTAEAELDFYRRKQKVVVVRHVSEDQIVAVIEVVSPGNKSSQHALDSFLEKVWQLFDSDIHVLILDLHAPGPRDPTGIHGAIWESFAGCPYSLPAARPLTFAAYECQLAVRAYVEQAAVGEKLPSMPLFLRPRAHVLVPLDETYQAAFSAVPQRWRSELQ
ncbi:MAG: DUF4058 family protein [Pirellulales bacterium]